jgi:hypothetical protein
MNDKQLPELLEYIGNICKDSTDFVLAQAPEVVQQLILLKRVECSIFLCLSVSMVTLLTWGAQHSIQKLREAHDEQDDGPIILWIIATVGTVFGAGVLTLVTIDHISDTLTVWLAPKVYILEYAANLLK